MRYNGPFEVTLLRPSRLINEVKKLINHLKNELMYKKKVRLTWEGGRDSKI